MKKIISLPMVSVLLFVLIASACTTAAYSGLQFTAADVDSYTELGEFQTSIFVPEFFGVSAGSNLFNISAKNMDNPAYDAIQREIAKMGGDAAINVSIVQKAEFVDMLLSMITLNIFAPGHVELSGTVIRYDK